MTVVLVTGDRYWSNRQLILTTLDAIHLDTPITRLVEGCARGADRLAGDHVNPFHLSGWAYLRHIPGGHHPAHWRHTIDCDPGCRRVVGRPAGVIRNAEMLDQEQVDRVVAFHPDLSTSRGTRDMVDRATRAGIPVLLITGRA